MFCTDVIPTVNEEEAFKDIDAAFLVGAMPRREGMERRDLLSANINIFNSQGQALNKFAKRTVKVLVVGNPANTNALVCSNFAPDIPKENFSCLTRLDQNRAQYQVFCWLASPCPIVFLLFNIQVFHGHVYCFLQVRGKYFLPISRETVNSKISLLTCFNTCCCFSCSDFRD